MKMQSLGTFLFSICLVAGTAAAQARPPAGPPPGSPPPGGHGPGSPGGPGGPGGLGGPGGPGNGSSPLGSAAGGAGGSAGSVPHFGPVGRWWDDRSVVQTIGLSKTQQKKMDVVFDANKQAILSTYKTFLAEQAKLNALSKQPQVDQTRMFEAIDSVSQARAALQKANTQMLLQIRQQMDADQIGKLEKLQ